MQEIITTIVAQEIAGVLILVVMSALGAAGTFALAQFGRLFGEERKIALSDKLGAAIERAKAAAEKKGLTGDSLEAWVVSYLKQTMAGTVRKLKASDSDLAKRVAGQVAQSTEDKLAAALRRAGAAQAIPVLDAVSKIKL